MYRKDPAPLAALTPEPYRVTQKNGTGYPGTGEPLADFAPGSGATPSRAHEFQAVLLL